MATEAQILANRSNARKSTGPRTPEGKAVVSQNAVKHGLSGGQTVIAGEDLGEFEFYRERMLAELDPVGEMESTLAERIVSLSWRLKRAERLQAVAFDSLLAKQENDLSEELCKGQDADGDSLLGRALVRDFSNGRVLDRLLMYERRIENSLYRTMAELKRHRILQEVEANGIVALRRALARDDDAGENVVRAQREAVLRTEATYAEPAGSVPVRAYVSRAVCPRCEGGTASTRITPDVVTTNEDGQAAGVTGTLHDPSCKKTKPISPGGRSRPRSLRYGTNGGFASKRARGNKANFECGGGFRFEVSGVKRDGLASNFAFHTSNLRRRLVHAGC